jgi:hypothetical protein
MWMFFTCTGSTSNSEPQFLDSLFITKEQLLFYDALDSAKRELETLKSLKKENTIIVNNGGLDRFGNITFDTIKIK